MVMSVRYNCAKIHHCRICVTDSSRGGGTFWPALPHPWAALRRPILNRVKQKRHKFIGMCFFFTWLNMQILNLCHRWHRRIYNSLKYLNRAFCKNRSRLKIANCFRKTLHLRCLTGSWIVTWKIKKICVIVKTKCFYSFTNNSKLKQN